MARRSPHAVCLGHAALDLLGAVAHWPGPDRKTRLRWLDRQGGGPAATAAVTLRRLGAPARFLGVVGDDDVGALILEGLRAERVDTAGVRVRPGRRSHLSVCVAAGTTRNVLWDPGDAPDLRLSEIPRGMLDGAGVLLLDGRHPDAAVALARRARRIGIPVLLDAGTLRPATRKLLGEVDACVASVGFARELAGSGRAADMLRALRAAGPAVVGVTLGARGAVGRERGGPLLRVPAVRVRVVDTTGAGDAYHGAFAWGLLRGRPLAWTMRFAAVVAGLKCRAPGGRRGLPGLRGALRGLPPTPSRPTLV